MNLFSHIGNYFRSLAVRFTGNSDSRRNEQFNDAFDELISLERELAIAQQSILEFVERNQELLNSAPQYPAIASGSNIGQHPNYSINGTRWEVPSRTELNKAWAKIMLNKRLDSGLDGLSEELGEADLASKRNQSPTSPPPGSQLVSVKIRLESWQGLEAEMGFN